MYAHSLFMIPSFFFKKKKKMENLKKIVISFLFQRKFFELETTTDIYMYAQLLARL